MLKKVSMICAFCKKTGIAQIDTTEEVILMVCSCPSCLVKAPKINNMPDNTMERLAALFPGMG